MLLLEYGLSGRDRTSLPTEEAKLAFGTLFSCQGARHSNIPGTRAQRGVPGGDQNCSTDPAPVKDMGIGPTSVGNARA